MSAASPATATGHPEPGSGRRRRPLRTLLVVVVVVLAVVLVLLIAGVALQRTESGTFTVSAPVDEVRIDVPVGRVEVVAVAGGTVEVAYDRRFTWDAAALDTTVRDGVLTLDGGCGPSPLRFLCSVDYRVRVPADTVVTGSTAAGDLVVEGLSGAVDVSTSAGDVSATRLSGPVRLRSAAGEVSGTGLASAQITVRTNAGDVDIATVAPPEELLAQTSAGDVDLLVPDIPYDVTADTSVGEVTVEVVDDPSAPRTITARTSAGDVRIVGR